jgi:hypothetical protein
MLTTALLTEHKRKEAERKAKRPSRFINWLKRLFSRRN